MPQVTRKALSSPHANPSTYSFQGSNSSHSKDSGEGGRTYHMPNYATSYANEKSNLITIHLEEDRGARKTTVFLSSMILLFIGLPILFLVSKAFRSPDKPSSDSLRPSMRVPEGHDWTIGHKAINDGPTSGYKPSNAHIAEKETPRQAISQSLFWETVRPADNCLGFEAREYSARLRGFPYFSDWKNLCENTPITINGIRYETADRCEKKGLFGGVFGFWKSEDKAMCSAYWGKFNDKGCIGKNIRSIESRALGVRSSRDKEKICASMPATIQEKDFKQPKSCQGRFWGIYGQWEITDPTC